MGRSFESLRIIVNEVAKAVDLLVIGGHTNIYRIRSSFSSIRKSSRPLAIWTFIFCHFPIGHALMHSKQLLKLPIRRFCQSSQRIGLPTYDRASSSFRPIAFIPNLTTPGNPYWSEILMHLLMSREPSSSIAPAGHLLTHSIHSVQILSLRGSSAFKSAVVNMLPIS